MFMPTRSVCLAALCLCAAANAGVVYDNTTTRTGLYHEILGNGQASGPEDGNQVTLAGTDRVVTNVSVKMRILGPGAAGFKSQVRLYANDGPGGRPGTQLWASALTFGVIDAGADITYSFPVPNVPVPDTLTFTVQLTDRQVFFAPIGLPTFGPPTVGSSPGGYWHGSGGVWDTGGAGSAPFGATITAVPAPAGLGAAAIGILAIGRRRR